MGNWDKPPPRRAYTPSPQSAAQVPASRPGSGSSGTIPRVPASERRAPGPTDRPLVTIVCEAGSDVLEPTHQFLTAYAATRVRPHVAPRLSVAVYELLANALNYGSVTGDVVVEFFYTRTMAIVRVTNEAIPARIQMLTEHAARVRENAEGLFMEEMRRSVSGGIPHPMLGLLRVVHEAGLSLDVDVKDRRIIVSASVNH